MKKRTRDQEKAANAEDAAKQANEAGMSTREAKVLAITFDKHIGGRRAKKEKHRRRGNQVRFLGYTRCEQKVQGKSPLGLCPLNICFITSVER